ncbi:MAG: hypothetical protein GY853_03220 [PVC group bacterium]|nr:hypothetical protein [PVC group bacterium]
MADKNVSPEKRLLKIIEGQQDEGAVASTLRTGKKYMAPSSLKGRWAFFKEKFKKGNKTAKRKSAPWDIKKVNQVLSFSVALLFIGFISSMLVDYFNLNSDDFAVPQMDSTAQATPIKGLSLLQPEDHYLQKVSGRDLFKFGDIVVETPAFREEDKPQVSRLQSLMKGLKLVGVSWGKVPDAIVENESANKTYFVKAGSMIEEATVKNIFKDKVVLELEGEEAEIR